MEEIVKLLEQQLALYARTPEYYDDENFNAYDWFGQYDDCFTGGYDYGYKHALELILSKIKEQK